MRKTILVILSVFMLLGCSEEMRKLMSKLKKEPFTRYAKTSLPADTTKLFLEDGITQSDTVSIYLQGGPIPVLDFTFNNDSILNEFPGHRNYKRIYLHQAQTINSTIVNSGDKFTFEMAKEEGRISAEMLYRTVKYFKDKNKVVFVISHSFGSFIVPEFLSTKPNIADKIVIMAGRLDMNDEIWKSFSIGGAGGFDKDAITPFTKKNNVPFFINHKIRQKVSTMSKVAAGLGYNRFTQRLQSIDLSNVLYVFGTKDVTVGTLNNEEKSFLKDAKAYLLEVDGDHSSVFHPDVLKIIHQNHLTK